MLSTRRASRRSNTLTTARSAEALRAASCGAWILESATSGCAGPPSKETAGMSAVVGVASISIRFDARCWSV
jgi:hypothetical protein